MQTIYEAGSGSSLEAESARVLILDLPASRTVRKRLQLVGSHPVWGVLLEHLERMNMSPL